MWTLPKYMLLLLDYRGFPLLPRVIINYGNTDNSLLSLTLEHAAYSSPVLEAAKLQTGSMI